MIWQIFGGTFSCPSPQGRRTASVSRPSAAREKATTTGASTVLGDHTGVVAQHPERVNRRRLDRGIEATRPHIRLQRRAEQAAVSAGVASPANNSGSVLRRLRLAEQPAPWRRARARRRCRSAPSGCGPSADRDSARGRGATLFPLPRGRSGCRRRACRSNGANGRAAPTRERSVRPPAASEDTGHARLPNSSDRPRARWRAGDNSSERARRRRVVGEQPLLARRQRQGERFDDVAGEVVLELEDIVER